MTSPILCLAFALYFEAGTEGREGMLMVAWTILNRVESVKYPDTVCDVIKQPKQFSFYGRAGEPDYRSKTWVLALNTASDVIGGRLRRYFHEYHITHYYAPKRLQKAPHWARRYKYIKTVGGHRFYGLERG